MASWFSVRSHCDACGLRFERDEESEYWLGAFTLNFILTEIVFAIALLVVLLATWPAPPWRAILWGGAALMAVTPIVLYPFCKGAFLGIDLIFRPPGPDDFAGATRP